MSVSFYDYHGCSSHKDQFLKQTLVDIMKGTSPDGMSIEQNRTLS